MKKTFSLISAKHTPDRMIELVKAEINKYLARERRKTLPEGVDFWDFDCRCGKDENSATLVHVSEISKQIDKVVATKVDSFYVEILAKPGKRKPKTKS